MSFDPAPHLAAVGAALTAGGVPWADGEAPTNAQNQIVVPVVVLELPVGGEFDGTAEDPDSDADWRFQLTCIGQVRAQALWLARQSDLALSTHPVTVAGRSVQRIRRIATPGAQRDHAVTPALWYVTPLYGATSFPA